MRLIDADTFIISVVKSGFGAEFINKVTALLINTPTIEPKQEWISCKERLPNENDEYIITMGKDGFDKEGSVTWAMFDKLKKKFYFPGGRVNYYIAVTAWMPKPKPWKGINNE
jgi:hypothetical protein